MIAFGCVDHRPRDLRALRRAGHPARRRARLRGPRLAAPPARSSATTTCCSTRPPKLDDLEALVLLHQDAEIVDPDFCDEDAARRSATPTSRSSAAPARSASAASPGGRARSPGRRSPTATRSSAAARSRRLPGRPTRRPAYAETGEVDTIDGFVMALSPWAVRNLRFDESLGQRSTATTSTSACRRARRRQEGRDRRPAGRPPPLPGADPRRRGLDRGPHQDRREVGRPACPGVGTRAAARTGRRAPGAPRPRPRPQRMIALSAKLYRDAKIEHLMRQREDHARRSAAKLRAARHELAVRLQALELCSERRSLLRRVAARLRRRRRSAASTRLISSREIAGFDPRRTRESRSATPKAREFSMRPRSSRCSTQPSRLSPEPLVELAQPLRLAAGPLLLLARSARAGLDPLDVAAGDLDHAVGLEPLEERVAVPRVEHARRRASAHGASWCQTTPKPKNAGTIAKRRPSCSRDEVLDAVSTPLRGPPSRSAAQSERQPAVGDARLPRDEADVVGERLAVLLGDLLGRRSRCRAARAASRRRGRCSSGSSAPGARSRSAAAPR